VTSSLIGGGIISPDFPFFDRPSPLGLDFAAEEPERLGQKRWINLMHCEDLFRSVGLHLFQELSTLDQQLPRTLLRR
jgi:hypothetical protein